MMDNWILIKWSTDKHWAVVNYFDFQYDNLHEYEVLELSIDCQLLKYVSTSKDIAIIDNLGYVYYYSEESNQFIKQYSAYKERDE